MTSGYVISNILWVCCGWQSRTWKYREGRWLPENVPKQLYGCRRTSVCSSIASQPWDESLKLSQRSWVPVARSPMEETKACPRSHDQLRKQRWLHHLSGPAFSSSRVTGTLLMTPPWIIQSLKRKIKKMKGRMFGGVSLVWRFPLMPVGPMCLHKSLGVWNSYQMALTHALYWICVLFLFYYFNRHGCFYYLSRASWYQGRQTDFEEFQEVSELLMFCFAFNVFFFWYVLQDRQSFVTLTASALLLTSQPKKENITRVKCHWVVFTNLESSINPDLARDRACQFLNHGERVW